MACSRSPCVRALTHSDADAGLKSSCSLREGEIRGGEKFFLAAARSSAADGEGERDAVLKDPAQLAAERGREARATGD